MPLPDSPPPPDWVELGAKPNRGLDLTGLRLPVQSIGNDLLNGITTITPSVRYVSFYSWIVLSYLNARRPDNSGAFTSFADPVETAVAVGNIIRNRQVTGVVGARLATRIVDEKTDPVPLTALVEQSAANIYFNPCQQLRFSLPPTLKVPGLSTERGKPLAEFIRASVEKTQLGCRFSSGEMIAQATLSDLEEFGHVTYLAGISEEEAGLLTDGIIPVAPSGHDEIRRIGTYGCVLGVADALDRIPSEDDFFIEAQRPKRSLPSPLHSTLNGWLKYLVRDAIAVGHEHVLQEIVQNLLVLSKSRSAVLNSEVIGLMLHDAQVHNDALDAFGLLKQGENASEVSFEELYSRVEKSTAGDQITELGLIRWSGPLSELALINSIQSYPARALALLPVIWCLTAIRSSFWPEPLSNPFEGRVGIGWNAIGIHEVITPAVKRFISQHYRLGQVMFELALRTVEQHLRVSWSRMAVDVGHDVALLTTEADRWQSRSGEKHVLDYRADRSTSRLYQVINWLQQLNLMDKSGLTPRGKAIYQRAVTLMANGLTI